VVALKTQSGSKLPQSEAGIVGTVPADSTMSQPKFYLRAFFLNLLCRRRALFSLPAFVLVTVLCESLVGQKTEAGLSEQDKNFTLSLDVQLVALSVTVLDRKGSFVPGLSKENFQVFENGQRQDIQLFNSEDVPLTIGLVVDSSGSMRDRRREVNSAALAFVEASKPEDEMFVVNFNEEVQLGLPPDQAFSSNVGQLREALSRLVVRGQTSLYDALWMALEHLKKGRHDKKALVVLSDGADNASKHNFRETLTAAQRSQATIYSVGIYEPGSEDRDPKSLKEFARATGGEAVFPQSIDELEAICRHFARTIRTQYTLGYNPSNTAKDGSYRVLRVLANAPSSKKLTVRTREGYFGPKAATP
jgi:VWFA-related protein